MVTCQLTALVVTLINRQRRRRSRRLYRTKQASCLPLSRLIGFHPFALRHMLYDGAPGSGAALDSRGMVRGAVAPIELVCKRRCIYRGIPASRKRVGNESTLLKNRTPSQHGANCAPVKSGHVAPCAYMGAAIISRLQAPSSGVRFAFCWRDRGLSHLPVPRAAPHW